MVHSSWTMDNGQWTMDNGQWTMDNGQWTMDNGQWTMIPERQTHKDTSFNSCLLLIGK
jgi:hypothetical protein